MYDPNWFMERELMFSKWRACLEDESLSDLTKEFMEEVITSWEDLVELYRDYVDCYDPVEKQKRKKVFVSSYKSLKKAMDLV